MLARFFLLLLVSSLALACSNEQSTKDDDAAVVPDAADECAERADGTPCGLDRICLGAACHDSVCGDGYVDALRGEECDDGNFTDGDGCDNDCTHSCHADEDCQDETVCNGTETCIDVPNGKQCQMGTPLDCAPTDGSASPCTIYVCHPVDGCDPENFENAITCYADFDGDEYPDPDVTSDFTEGGECDCPEGFIRKRSDDLWDCNDARADVKPGRLLYDALPHCPGQAAPGERDLTCQDPASGCAPFTCANDATPSFDYDCDGAERPRFTQTRAACGGIGGCQGSGWQGADVPACGITASYVQCNAVLALCESSVIQRAQECR
jgi:cysteine-rich repeat protein